MTCTPSISIRSAITGSNKCSRCHQGHSDVTSGLVFAWISDKTKNGGIAVMVAITAYLIAIIVLRGVQRYASNWCKLRIRTAVNGLAVGYYPIHNAWIEIKCRTPLLPLQHNI
jgi:hypothetical protein